MSNKNNLLNVLLGAGLYLLDPVRERLADSMDDIRDKAEDLRGQAQDHYATATDRLGRAHRAIRGEDSNVLGTVAAVLIGVGIGVGLGMLFAPSSGEDMRNDLAGKVNDIGGKMKERFNEAQSQAGSGTY